MVIYSQTVTSRIILQHVSSTEYWAIFRLYLISGFHCAVDEICVLLGYYLAYSGNSLPTFRDNLSVPTWRVQIFKNRRVFRSCFSWTLKLGPIGCLETSMRTYHSTLRNIRERVQNSPSGNVTKLRKICKGNSVNIYEIQNEVKFSI
jgi:hypothetical protein